MIKEADARFVTRKERISKPFLLYFTLSLVYLHAITCVPLGYYLPQLSKLLPLSYAIILSSYVYFFILSVLANRYHINMSIFLLLLYIFIGIISFVNIFLYYGIMAFIPVIVGLYRNMLPIVFVFITYYSVHNISQGFKLFIFIVLVNSFIAIFGVVMYLFPIKMVKLYSQYIEQTGGVPLHFGGVLRMTSILWFPLLFGMLMAINSIIVWNLILNDRKLGVHWIVVYIFSIIGTVASFTRTAWLTLFVGSVISSFFLLRSRSRRFIRCIAVLIISIVIILNIPIPMGHYDNIIGAVLGHIKGTFDYDEPKPRLEDLKVNISRIVRNPIGYGLGTAGHAAERQMRLNSSVIFKEYKANDNNYLSIVLQLGIQGLVIFMLAHIIAIKQMLSKLRRSSDIREQIILKSTISLVAGMMVAGFFLNVWEYNLLSQVYYILLGIGLKVSTLVTRE